MPSRNSSSGNMGRFYQEVIMRGHQTVGMHLDPVSFRRLADIFQELFPVPLAPVYIHSRVSAIHHVIESTRDYILNGRAIQKYLFISAGSIFFCFSHAILTA